MKCSRAAAEQIRQQQSVEMAELDALNQSNKGVKQNYQLSSQNLEETPINAFKRFRLLDITGESRRVFLEISLTPLLSTLLSAGCRLQHDQYQRVERSQTR